MIKPALRKGAWVICDRFTDSTYAYQGGGKGVDVSVISQLESLSVCQSSQLLQPDLTLFFDVSVDVAMDRLKAAGKYGDNFECLDPSFFRRVRHAFLDRAIMFSERIRVVDAEKSIQQVTEKVEFHLRCFMEGQKFMAKVRSGNNAAISWPDAARA